MFRSCLHVVWCACLLGVAAHGEVTTGQLPVAIALRAANPEMLSGGLFSAIDAASAAGRPAAIRAGMVDLSKGIPGAVLDARVGPNTRVGDDPPVLPASQLGQAEPHLYRSSTDANLLLATVQEGRFSDAGALDCGYGVSTDGGLTWTRALIPQLTQTSGGRFNRATDPVAAIGPQGDLYLNTLASVSGAFATGAVVVSRSTDQGATWSPPAVVFESSTGLVSPDKNWIAVNDYANTPNAGRLVVTWTNFTSTSSGAATGNNLLASVSDDRGVTWSTPVAVTPAGSINQGSQPVFLPDGSLLVVYVTFPNLVATSPFVIECKRSLDGGRTFPLNSTIAVGAVAAWDDPDLRDGVFLPSATVARQSGDVFVTFTGIGAGSPRVFVVHSADGGTTWSAPVVASDNPAHSSVVNPSVAATPDGRAVSVVFMDKRNASDGHNFMDVYAAQSFDAGTTWEPNTRLTDVTTDIRYGPLTTRGYMFGDYLAIAPSTGGLSPAVAIWCDARTGDSDPYVARLVPRPSTEAGYAAWASSHGVAAGGYWDDPDADGEANFFEYLNGTDPLHSEYSEALVVHRDSPAKIAITWLERADAEHPFSADGVSIVPVTTLATSGFRDAPLLTANLAASDLPTAPPRAGLVWRGVSAPITPGTAYAIARAVRTATTTLASGPVATISTDSRLINVSCRAAVGTAASQTIVGFVIDGQKSILLRAAGPALAAYGVTELLANPQLTLTPSGPDPASAVTTTGWTESAATNALFGRLGAFPFASGSSDAALLRILPKGAYSCIIAGANGTTGNALVEAYDADPSPGSPAGPRIVNLSTRASVIGAGSNTLIAGFVIGGTQPRRILIRASGPSLAPFDVPGTLKDPVLTLYAGGRSAPIASNDDWSLSRSAGAIAETAARIGAFPFAPASLDAALLVTLDPGNYTATVLSADGSTGIALVEVYDAD